MDEQTPTGPGDGGGDDRVPLETDGDGPVDLGDRTSPGQSGAGYTGSPAGNQGKAEPMPPTPGHADPNAPLEAPSLGEMNVGAADPQTPRHPAAAHSQLTVPAPVRTPPTDLGGPGTVPSQDRPVVSAGSSTGRGSGPEVPVSSGGGSSGRAPGVLGHTGPDEAVETDMVAGALQMGPSTGSSPAPDDDPGQSQGVAVPAKDAAIGTSEEHAAVRGVRTPLRTDAPTD